MHFLTVKSVHDAQMNRDTDHVACVHGSFLPTDATCLRMICATFFALH